jgi:hypothetical protein
MVEYAGQVDGAPLSSTSERNSMNVRVDLGIEDLAAGKVLD